ncbi:MAG: DNA-3-methyladenine glycosylase [Actinomycetota bacterium]|nr:DNA-3-methyladenine glycosylase [Actinomycetota bacterium]
MTLPRAFYDRPVLDVARDLLGTVLVRRTDAGVVAVRLTEVEAYAGETDPGSHAFRGSTPRNATMFGEPGHAYVYFTYGMHHCVNLVCGPAGEARAVLLRAGEVVEGVELAAARRGRAVRPRDLSRGPARLTVALDIDRQLDGVDVCDPAGPLHVRAGPEPAADREPAAGPEIVATPRTGVSGPGGSIPWRFFLSGEPSVSPYRPAAPRRPRTPA